MLPLSFSAALGDKEDVFNYEADTNAATYLEHSGHRSAGCDSLVCMPRHRSNVMSEKDATFSCRSLKHIGINSA